MEMHSEREKEKAACAIKLMFQTNSHGSGKPIQSSPMHGVESGNECSDNLSWAIDQDIALGAHQPQSHSWWTS